MAYIFDSSPLIILFRHFYPRRFPSLWERFESMIEENKIISVREVFNEINSYGNEDRLIEWARNHKEIFLKPNRDELLLVTEIFKVEHFQSLIRKKERLQGKPVADPFIIGKAKILNGTVVTQEQWKENSAKLPNVCERFEVECIDLETFMEKENWVF
ncbi:MAG: DUF4411 family protein [Desulfobacteraceae bacterium]|nr:DUF4411 family protein [Desulfobacteraceae bacterium]